MSVPPLHPPPLSLSLNCTLVHLRSAKSQGGGRGCGVDIHVYLGPCVCGEFESNACN